MAAYRAALRGTHTRARAAGMGRDAKQSGHALSRLGERESRHARLEEAVAAYRAALQERTRERVPLDWATTQNNLGNALSRLGEREAGTARLEEAVAAYRAALQELTQERVPLDWAGTQNNLGAALRNLGEREAGTARLEEAVAAYRAALQEHTQERVPLLWAATQNNLGSALRCSGERESQHRAPGGGGGGLPRGAARNTPRARAARLGCDAKQSRRRAFGLGERERHGAPGGGGGGLPRALQERTQERVPLDWAMSYGAQGATMMLIAERTVDSNMAQSALDQLELALKTARDSRHAPLADDLETKLAEARRLVKQLQ